MVDVLKTDNAQGTQVYYPQTEPAKAFFDLYPGDPKNGYAFKDDMAFGVDRALRRRGLTMSTKR